MITLDHMAKKKAVIIGFGGIGHSWLNAIKGHPSWECIGIVDTDTELLQNVGPNGFTEDQVFMSIEEACQFGERPDCAIIGTPIPTHHSIVRECMDLDLNVICEKNMADTLYQGRQMVQCAIDKPYLCTAVGTQYRYGTQQWAARKLIESGKLGNIGMIKWESADYRGEKRWSWRRHLSDIYLQDMAVHWIDTIRYITGLDVVQVKADCFMPRYSDWHGSSEVMANLALSAPNDYDNRHNWVWVQLYGGWQRRGPTGNDFVIYGAKGQGKLGDFGVELKMYTDKNDSRKFEEDAFLPIDAGPVEGTPYEGQRVILEMMSKGIDSKGKIQPGTNFKEAFRSFAVSVAMQESSRYGKTIWVPDYWKGLLP